MYSRRIKRGIDFVGATVLLCLLFPILLAIALLVKCFSPGPVLFLQTRVGLKGREFKIFKFRTMVEEAEKVGPHFTDPGDPRVTPIGKVLRKTSLDELPQLLNILLGEMSFVGPRPDVPAQRNLYSDEEFRLRHSVRPGLTGLAQVLGRQSCNEKQRKRFDLFYATRINCFLDCRVVLLTGRAVVAGSY